VISLIDGRRKEALFLKNYRAELIRHVGGRPNAVELALIERASRLALYLEAMDLRLATGEPFTEMEHRTYLAWSNTLARVLTRIGVKASSEAAPSLAEVMADLDRERAGEAGK
jgi:hypothetical protein